MGKFTAPKKDEDAFLTPIAAPSGIHLDALANSFDGELMPSFALNLLNALLAIEPTAEKI